MDIPGPAVPALCIIRDNRRVLEPIQLLRPLPAQTVHVEVLPASAAPVQMDFPGAGTLPDQLLHQRLYRSETGTTGNKYRRRIAFTKIERTEGALDGDNILDLQIIKNNRRCFATGYQPYVQLNTAVFSIRRRQTVAAGTLIF